MTENRAPQGKATHALEQNVDLVQLAMEILGSATDRAMVEKAVKKVQHWKAETKKEDWTPNLRYGYALKVEQRDAAKSGAAAIERVLTALKPVRNSFLFELQFATAVHSETSDDDTADDNQLDANLAALERLQRHLQTIADSKVRHGSRSDPRRLLAVQEAVMLLEAAGKSWTTTRHGEADQLAAALWGEPDADFQEHLRAYRRLCSRRQAARASRERPKKSVAVTG
jgi:hypothetical protein